MNPDGYIEPEATFITPATFDEEANWCNRQSLLNSYRHLVEVMLQHGIQPRSPTDVEPD